MLDFIQTFHAKNQRPPTNREIGRGVGIRSTSHVNYHLRILEEKGFIERIRNTSRGLRLKSPLHVDNEIRAVPLLGRIAAGQPIEAVTSNDEVVPVSAEFAPEGTYALQVRGQSMTDARGANPEATLKRFYREDDRIRLQPANSQMEPIYVDPEHLQIQGRVMAVLRKL